MNAGRLCAQPGGRSIGRFSTDTFLWTSLRETLLLMVDRQVLLVVLSVMGERLARRSIRSFQTQLTAPFLGIEATRFVDREASSLLSKEADCFCLINFLAVAPT